MRVDKYMKMLRKLASLSTHHQHKLGCVIVKKNRVVSFGTNKLQTHPKSPHAWHSLHAEVAAVLNCGPYELKNSTLIVLRENHLGLAMARPCKYCMGMIREMGIKKIVYSSPEGFKEEKV